MNGWNLDYWKSEDWRTVQDRLMKLEAKGVTVCPGLSRIDHCLHDVPLSSVRVVIVGQDPYPDPRFATGHAFSIPSHFRPREFPLTLREIFKEYCNDLGYPSPVSGSLQRWYSQGVLLWNAIPTCEACKSLSHEWREYDSLTREVLRRTSNRGLVFCFLGAKARRYVEDISDDNNAILQLGHPSPRGRISARIPFQGSRMFSTINGLLNEQGLQPIDWRLD